ncbi:MAG: Gfo/Idh/MocA family oxidoreductase [Scytolyngbya sp. HA4215-MV1]|nr:Gfo/Idh/MocA family oxidoreductase [Scytolyngbya sp. HA4215-MV1]
MPTPTGIAVFGVGRWGVNLLRNFLAHPQAEVLAVVDPCAERLTDAADRFGLSDLVVLDTHWQVALTTPGVEAVAIATPAQTHYALIRAALQQGLHVLSEKPLTLTVAESLELCHLAQQQQRQLVVDHTYLFHSAVEQGREVVQQGKLGRLRYGYAARTHLGPVRQDVDALWDLAIHDIAIFSAWLGQIPCQVAASGKTWLQPMQSDPVRFLASPTAGLADLVWLSLTYPNGFQAAIHLCWANPDKQRRLCLVGDRATLVFDELASHPLVLRQGQFQQVGQQFTPIDQSDTAFNIPPAEPLKAVCDHFLTCVQHNSPSAISSGWLGTQFVHVLCALTASLQQGGIPVEVQPLRF